MLVPLILFQRYRYIDAYQVDRKLQSVEQEFISKGSISDQTFMRMRSISHWRTGLIVSNCNCVTFFFFRLYLCLFGT